MSSVPFSSAIAQCMCRSASRRLSCIVATRARSSPTKSVRSHLGQGPQHQIRAFINGWNDRSHLWGSTITSADPWVPMN